MELEELKGVREVRLPGLGLTLYEAWKCVEHGECPEGVDPVDVEEEFWAVVDSLEAAGKRDVVGELERRYAEELRRRKVPVTA